jgi:hypothetical protein
VIINLSETSKHPHEMRAAGAILQYMKLGNTDCELAGPQINFFMLAKWSKHLSRYGIAMDDQNFQLCYVITR